MPTRTPVYTLTFNSTLTEDFIHTDSILASSTTLATFLNSRGQSEALVIYEDGELCHLQREPLSSSGWNFCGIGAVIESITAANSGSVWITDHAQGIWMSNAGHWNFISTLPGGGPSLSVGTDGTVYGVVNQSGDHHLFVFNPADRSFEDHGVVPITVAPVGNPESLWSVADGKLFTNQSGSWHAVSAPFESGDIPFRISIGGDESIWVLCDNGSIYSYDPSSVTCKKLQHVPSGVVSFGAVNAQTLYVLAVSSSYESRIFTNANGSWDEIPYAATPFNDISVGSDGSLWALDDRGRNWLRLEGEWIRQIMPTDLSGATEGHKVTEVVTGQHSNGSIQYAFFIMDGNLWSARLVGAIGDYGGYWAEIQQIFTGCSKIAAVNDPANSNLLIYGVSSKNNFVLVQYDDHKGWVAAEHLMTTSLQNLTPHFLFDGSWLTYAVINNQLYVGQGSLKSPAAKLTAAKTNGAPAKLQSLTSFSTCPHGMSGTLLAAIDFDQQVWVISSSSGTAYFTQLSNLAVAGVGAVFGIVAMLHPKSGARLYARDRNNSLWIIRQTATVANQATPNTIVWSDWHPLGNNCIAMATGCTIPNPDAPWSPPVDLFSLDGGYEVNVLSENATTGALTDLVMLKPDGTNTDAKYITRYVSEVTVSSTDPATGNTTPAAGFDLQVTASEVIGIWVGSNLYNVSSEKASTLTTDHLGRVTFAFFAADLHTPTFSFRAEGLETPPSLFPAHAVNKYLAGDPNAIPTKPAFTSDGSALLNAQVQRNPTWSSAPAPLLEDKNRDKAPKAAGAITSIYSLPLDPDAPSGQWRVADEQPTGMSASGFWHDLCKFPHDIEHAIKKDALKIRDVVVKLEEGVVVFTMDLANGLSQVLHLAINTLKDVVSAVKSVFRYIERAVDEVLDWLKSLFNWNDILNTKRVIEACLNGIMGRLADNFDPKSPVYVGELLDKYAGQLETSILGGFDKAKEHFSKNNTTFGQSAASQNYPEGARDIGDNPLSPTKLNTAQTSNGTQTNYVHTHVTNYTNQGGSFPSADSSAHEGLLQALFESIQRNLKQGKFKDEQMKTVDNLNSIFSDPANFGNVVMYDLITAVEDLIDILLKVIQGVLDTLFSLLGDALKAFRTLVTEPINIPVISWIYRQVAGHTLTMLDLFCLALAVPATLLYKLTFGVAHATPPFAEQQANDIVAALSDPATFPWPAIASKQASGSEGLLGSFPFPGSQALIPLAFLGLAFTDTWSDAIAYLKANRPPTNYTKDPAALFVSYSSIVFGLFARWLTAPFSLFATRGITTGETMQLSFWASGFLISAVNLVFTTAPNVGSPATGLAKFSIGYGVPMISTIGFFLTFLGIATTGVQIYEDATGKATYNAFQGIDNEVCMLPTALTALLEVKGEPAAEIAAAVLAAADFVFDLASGALGFTAALTSP